MQNKHILLIILIATIFVTSCVSVNKQTSPAPPSYKYNFASLYNPAATDMHPEIRIYLKSKTEALVFYKLPLNELKAITKDQTASEAKLMIKYIIRNTSDFSVADSGSLVNVINLQDKQDFISSYFNVKLPLNYDCKIVISIYGQKENSGKRLLADINPDLQSSQAYLPKIISNGENRILFGNYVNSDDTYSIVSEINPETELRFNYYKFTDYVNVPPYYIASNHSQAQIPDSSFVYSQGDSIIFPNQGVYVLQAATQTTGGLCLINVGKFYPKIQTVSAMLEPLKLIATNKEYNEIKNSANQKLAIDNFWISKSKSQKFAQEQIRVFYNRVSLANSYFTEDKEGWKTDRGMIYVMLGPPSIVNINATGEEWFYGENPEIAGILFIFDKINTQISGTSIVLKRDNNYQLVWAQALQTWKNGRIYTITN